MKITQEKPSIAEFAEILGRLDMTLPDLDKLESEWEAIKRRRRQKNLVTVSICALIIFGAGVFLGAQVF